MIRKLLLLCLLLGSISYGQYNTSAPWMVTLDDGSSSTTGTLETHTFYEISESFDAYWEGKDKSVKGSGYKPFKRWQNYWSNFVDPQGYLPTSKDLWNTWKNKQQNAGKTVNPTSNWSNIGPASPGNTTASEIF